MEVPLAALQKLEIPCETVFIVENKITGLCLPTHKKSIVFFELGYKVMLLKEIPWLRHRRLVYWGDIDTHGFAILSQLRSHLPHLQSIFMDEETLLQNPVLWGKENSPFLGECSHLTPEEAAVFTGLQKNFWGPQVRLEQERLPLSMFNSIKIP